MNEGHANGTFPTGLLLVKDGEARIWIADRTEAQAAALAGTWRLNLGGSFVVTRANWTIGS